MGHRKKPVGRRGPPPELAQAKALWQAGRFDDAIRSFGEAVRRAPNDLGVLIDAGRAFGARYQMDRSQTLLSKAIRLGSRRADVLHAVGESYRMLGRTVEAEGCFRAACRIAATPESELELAKICERRHALDEAADLVARVLRREPRSATALLLRARLERRRGEYDQAGATLRQLTAASSLPPKVLAETYGELGILFDAMADYDAAWDAILKCKQILLAQDQAVWETAQFVLARCRRMLEALTTAHFERWQSAGPIGSPLRLAVLTGFPRSGTTLLEQVLDAHPDVVSSEEAEVFGREIFPRLGENCPPDAPIEQLLDDLAPQQILDARQLYLHAVQAILGEPIGSRLLVDKNPAMTLMIPALRRVFPEAKILITLRDPRDVVLSCFLRYLPINPVSVCFLTLQRAVDRYVFDMGAWLKLREMFGDWLEVRYEHLVADLGREARRTLQALEVPWQDSVLEYRTRAASRPVRSPSYEEVSRPIFTTSAGRWQNYQHHLAPVLETLAPLVAALGYER